MNKNTNVIQAKPVRLEKEKLSWFEYHLYSSYRKTLIQSYLTEIMTALGGHREMGRVYVYIGAEKGKISPHFLQWEIIRFTMQACFQKF